MKTLTDQLIEKSNGLLKLSPEVTNPDYQMFDDGAATQQEAEFLYGLVRLVRPEHILETGTYTGISSLYMGQALKDNNQGDLVTLEIENSHKERAEKLWRLCEVSDRVKCELTPSLEYSPIDSFDLVFLDSEPSLRLQEVIRFFPYLYDGGYILIDDLFGHLGQGGPLNPDHPDIPNWPFLTLPDQIKEWLKTDKLRVIPLPNPRGLVLFYKTTGSDYKV